MGCTACACDAGLSNTGSACTPIMQVSKKIILVSIFDDLGNRNGVPYNSVLNQAFFDALVNEPDPSKRWFPLPDLKNIEDVRGENINESFNDQSTVFIQEGARTFSGLMIGNSGTGAGSPQLKGKIEAARCVDVGVYIIDKNGNLIGKNSADGLSLEPIAIDSQSLSAMLVKTTDSTIQKLNIMFNFATTERDEDLRMIACDEQGLANLLNLRGLIDVCATFTSITTTGFVCELTTEYGTPINKGHDKGLLIGDFTLYNKTDAAPVVITSVTETSDGVYTFVIPAQTSGDDLQLTPSKDGRDYTCVIADEITIP